MKKLFMILPLALILCFMVGCQDKEAMAELEKFRAQAEIEKQNIAIIKRVYEGFRKGNTEIFKESLAPDSACYSPSGSANPLSADETVGLINTLFTAFPNFGYNIVDIIAKGDKVITRESQQGTHQGEFLGIPATGNKIDLSLIVIFRIKDGKIVEIWEEGDFMGIMQQLGMELKPEEEEKE